MRGDFSRDTYNPRRDYNGVLMQQGRLLLDADWNEQADILRQYMRALARDVIGPHGGPKDNLGFEIIVNPAALMRRLSHLRDADPRRPPAAALPVLQRAIESGAFIIAPGRYYVDGVAIENDAFIAYADQRGYPFPGSPSPDALKHSSYVVYLDVWERLVTYVEDPAIRDPALGGPDTAARSQTIWQVRVLLTPPDVFPDPSIVNTFPQTGSGRIRARALFENPSPSRYTGTENRLYRVEVHTGGTAASGATFKWSRQNGSVIFPISTLTRLDSSHLVVELAPDAAGSARLARDDRVELIDDDYVLRNTADPLLVVTDLDETKGLVTLDDGAGKSSVRSDGKHLLLRRWDQGGDASLGFTSPVAPSSGQSTSSNWRTLEDGIQISFSASGDYRTGDYWLIPARTATGDVEWPQEKDESGKPALDAEGNVIPAALLSRGPKHVYCPLAVRETNTRILDCRQELAQARSLYPKSRS